MSAIHKDMRIFGDLSEGVRNSAYFADVIGVVNQSSSLQNALNEMESDAQSSNGQRSVLRSSSEEPNAAFYNPANRSITLGENRLSGANAAEETVATYALED